MTTQGSSNFWRLLEILARWRGFIAGIVALVTVSAVVAALLLPKWYEATAVLLPPKDISIPAPGTGRLADVVSVTKGLDLPLMVTSADVYARMLKSHSIARRVIERFHLRERFEVEKFAEAYEILQDRADFRVAEEGLLEVSYEDKDPIVAADIANSFVDELDSINREIVTERVSQNRRFIEDRLAQVQAGLDSARAAFEAFQLTHKAIDFGEQTRLAIEQATTLKVQLAQLEIDIAMKEQTLGPNNAELVELKQRRQTIRDQLRVLESSNPDSSFFSLPVAEIPALRGQFEVLYSKVRVAESLYKILLEQLEQVKFQEQESTPTLSVLDRATPPEIPSRPRRALIVLGAFGLSLVLSTLAAAFFDYLMRLRQVNPEDYRRASMFFQAFLGWIPGMRRTRPS